MRAVVGLGNPGQEFLYTRHNVGFWVIGRLLRRQSWRRKRYPWGEVYSVGDNFILRPLTYMNRSGDAVRELLSVVPLPPKKSEFFSSADILIVYDDLDLPVGEVRLRPKGGAGGHLGMRSVIAALGTEDVPRLRVGIGPLPPNADRVEFVLSPPRREEVEPLAKAADVATEIAQTFLADGLEAALDHFSRAPKRV